MSRKINVISRKIDKEDRAMLRDLLEVGSATPDKFEVKILLSLKKLAVKILLICNLEYIDKNLQVLRF